MTSKLYLLAVALILLATITKALSLEATESTDSFFDTVNDSHLPKTTNNSIYLSRNYGISNSLLEHANSANNLRTLAEFD